VKFFKASKLNKIKIKMIMMRKIFLFVVLVSISIGAMAQRGKVTSASTFIDQGDLARAKTDLEQALLDPKSANLPITFFTKGKLAQAAYEAGNKELYPDPLSEAYAAYEKAMELDEKGQMKRRIISGMVYDALAADLYEQGGTQFDEQDFQGALKSFETQIRIAESDMYVGAVDTGMYYNAGVAAINSGSYDAALKHFQTCADMKYMGITPYYQIYEANIAKGDTATAEATLTALPGLFPDDKTITLQLIDLYIKSGKNTEAQKYITMAKESEPTNHTLYFAAGIIYLNEEKYDEAIAELQKSIDLNSEMFDTQYAIGAAYINKAAAMYKAANDIMDVAQYNTAVASANEVYNKALPFMEKAYALNTGDIYTMRNLKELYYRLQMTDKYNDISAKLSAAEGN
jgi:tetratricopeptide (TPR) repeat protein